MSWLRSSPLCVLLVWAASLSRGVPLEPLDPERSLDSLFPERTLVYAEVPQPDQFWPAGAARAPALQALWDSPIARLLRDSPELAAGLKLERLEAWLGEAWAPALRAQARGGLALGLAVGPKGVAWQLCVRGADSQDTRTRVETLLDGLAQEYGYRRGDLPRSSVHGADLWELGDELRVACRDSLVLIGNQSSYLAESLELAARADATGLAGQRSYAAARALAGQDSLLFAWIDRARIQALASLLGTASDAKDPFHDFDSASRKIAAHLLLGEEFTQLLGARDFALSAGLSQAGAELELRLWGAPSAGQEAPGEVARVHRTGRLPPDPALPGTLLDALLERDLARLYAQRVELLEPEELPALAKSETDLALLFGGQALGENVWPRLSPWMRVLVRPVAFAAGLEPELSLPALAVLVELADPQVDGPFFESAFQTGISLANVSRAQERKSGFLLQLDQFSGARMTTAQLTAPAMQSGPVDLIYNLAPAIVRVGSTLVLSTHADLAREIARSLQDNAAAAAAASECLRLDGRKIAAALRAERESLVLGKVLEEGLDFEAAGREIDGLLALLESLGEARLELERAAGAGLPQLRLSLQPSVPAGGEALR